jgi:hypothetical protein
MYTYYYNLLIIGRRLTSVKKDGSRDSSYGIINRHAVPPIVKEIIKPKVIIPMQRRDSFRMLKMSMDK